ncbi:helix-turn-helix domain-containing protein [Streptomyces xanthophaeus]|uniref:helix-turn-helix domain-containing protein n=1 Tax=Streptomyces xanthophaeus TaxID=67385 RepID=UPI0026499728|nr:helix-turn-helix domain-containing protein [Streptomyces xanthophaeus]WKD32037.1 helix-turn-helix domain-containing protein [Streptomyces xanthophaeus]
MSDQTKATVGTESARVQLSTEMRRIKEASQLSFGRLADRTHYSRSSWERFLNGKQLPTTVAVEQLAAVAGTDPEPLLDLLARAVSAPASGAPATAAPAQTAPVQSAAAQAAPETAPEAPAAVAVPDAPQAAVRPLRERPRAEWRRRFGVIGYITAGALLGSVATGLAFSSTAAGGRSPGAAGEPSDTRKSGGGDETATLVPGAGDIQVKCKSDTCLRHDPQAMECHWDATTAKSTFLRGMHIQLRYSAACQSVWGRIEGGAVGDKVIIRDARGTELEALIRFEHDSYTKMLAVSSEAPLEAMSVCGAIPAEKQMQCAPEGAVQQP